MRTKRAEVSEVSASIRSASRLKSSTTLKVRKRRPQANASDMKSADQTVSGNRGTYSGTRSRLGKRRRAALRRFNRVALYTRYIRLWFHSGRVRSSSLQHFQKPRAGRSSTRPANVALRSASLATGYALTGPAQGLRMHLDQVLHRFALLFRPYIFLRSDPSSQYCPAPVPHTSA
jgi:hypothetical protein